MIAASLLPAPKLSPVLDPGFRPAALARRAFAAEAKIPVLIALEQADGSVFHHATAVLEASHPQAQANGFFIERLCKTLLWAYGGRRIWISGPAPLAAHLQAHYRDTALGRFDSEIIGERIYGGPIDVIHTDNPPPARATSAPPGTPSRRLPYRFRPRRLRS